jgi:hypothetical protein
MKCLLIYIVFVVKTKIVSNRELNFNNDCVTNVLFLRIISNNHCVFRSDGNKKTISVLNKTWA